MPNSDSPRSKVPNQTRLEALGDAVAERNGGPRPKVRRRRSWKKIVGISALVLVLVIVAGGVADYFYLNSLVTKINVPNEVATYNDTENILLVGSTSRCALKVQIASYGTCAQGITGVNSDVVMILHLDLSTDQVSILSIPRDVFVPNARSDGANKIDAALYDGAGQLVAAVEDDFGIPINHFIELNFETFADVVNTLGGINMYFPMQVYDAYSGLKVLKTGCIHLDGFRALQVVRARHLQYKLPGDGPDYLTWPQEGLSDLARIRRDHEFLKVLGAAVKAKGITNPITDQSLATSIAPYLTVDSAFSVRNMLSLAEHFDHIAIGGVPELTVPVVEVYQGSNDVALGADYLYQGYYYGDVEFPIDPGVTQTVDRFLGLPATINTMNGKPLPAPDTVTVSVVNGTGGANQAAVAANGLKRYGYRIVGVGSATPFGTREETVIYHASNSAASLGAAQAVMHKIEGPAVMALGPTTDGAMVTVLTGSDLSVIAPASKKPKTTTTTSATTTTAKKSTSTTLPPNVTLITVADPPLVKVDNALGSPSDVNQPLAPWDPRSCGPHGTEGS